MPSTGTGLPGPRHRAQGRSHRHRKPALLLRAARARSVAELQAALAAVGLAKIDPRQPVRSLSAGQQRRVALVRLSLWNAKLWLLDEPASNLDAAGQAVLEALLKSHLESGGAAILATHHALTLPQAHCRLWHSPSEAA
ncbi:MAG: ATP-binding cassette domain-containing protein [Steroidobacteraceae bacterium]